MLRRLFARFRREPEQQNPVGFAPWPGEDIPWGEAPIEQDDQGYDPTSPKSGSYHDRMSRIWDERKGK